MSNTYHRRIWSIGFYFVLIEILNPSRSTIVASAFSSPWRPMHQHQLGVVPPPRNAFPRTSYASRGISFSISKTRLHAASMSASEINNDDGNGSETDYHWTRQTIKLAIPALVGMMADPLLSLIDTAYVGRVGATELAALGACSSIFHLAFNAFRATTYATTSLVGSASSEEEKQQITKISLIFGIFLGIIVMVTLEAAGPWFLKIMGVPRTSALFVPAHAYLSTRAYAAPAVLAIVVSEGAFRGYGNTSIPLVASLVAAVINLVLDPILMFSLGMGVKGAAAATAVAQVGAALIYAYFLVKRNMLPARNGSTNVSTVKIVRTILSANLAMVTKQGSLLLGVSVILLTVSDNDA
jgi:Na+-driven multidrug efflux pump